MSDQKVGLSRGSVKDKQFIQDSANNYIVESFIDVSEVAPGSGLPAAVDGQQYLVDDGVSGILGGWGSIAGLQNKDIIRYKASQLKWEIVFSASASEEGGKVYDKDSDTLFTFDGTDWNVASGAGGGVKNFAESLVASYKIANFETGNNAVFGTAGAFGGALSQEKVAPLDGKKSFKYVSGAASGNDWFYLLVDISEYARGGVIAFTFDYTWDGDEDIRVNIWDPTFTNEYSTELNSLKNTTNDNKKSRNSRTIYAHPDTETQVVVGFQINSAEVTGKTLIFDNVKVTDDIGTIGSSSEDFDFYTSLRLSGNVSIPSTASFIVNFDTVGSQGLDKTNAFDGVNGIVIQEDGDYHISVSLYGSGYTTDAVLDAHIRINNSIVRAMQTRASGSLDTTVVNDILPLKAGDLVQAGFRNQSGTTGTISSNDDFTFFTVAKVRSASTSGLRFLQVPNGEKLKDTFGALIAESGLNSIDSDPYGMIASVDTSVANIHRINFTPGFFSEPPIANAIFKRIGIGASDRWALGVVTSTYMEIYSYNSSNNRLGGPIHITCTRQAPSPEIVGVPVSIQGQTHEADSYVRLQFGNGFGSTATKIRRFGNILASRGSAITYIDSPTDGASFIVNESGTYSFSYTDRDFNGGSFIGWTINSTQLTTNIQSSDASKILDMMYGNVGGGSLSTGTTAYLNKGDIIRPHSNGLLFTSSDSLAICNIAKVGTQPLLDGGVVITDEDSVQNVYSARIGNNGTSSIVSQSTPFIQSVNTTALGVVQINFVPGFFTVEPAVTAEIESGGGTGLDTQVQALTTSSVQIVTKQNEGVFNTGFNIVVQRQGSDTKKLSSAISAYSSRVYKEDPIAWQRKELSSSILTNTTNATEMQFNNLEIGKTYRVHLQAEMTAGSDIRIRHNGQDIGRLHAGAGSNATSGTSVIFTATTTVLEVFVQTQPLLANLSFAILEELPFHSVTSKWS
jgi:hypothetical protein